MGAQRKKNTGPKQNRKPTGKSPNPVGLCLMLEGFDNSACPA